MQIMTLTLQIMTSPAQCRQVCEYPNKNQKPFTFLENYVGFRLRNAIYFVEAIDEIHKATEDKLEKSKKA
jgi:hypothetical protein